MKTNQLDLAVKIFHQRGAAFHPIAAIQIIHIANLFYLRPVDMAANHTVGLLVARHLGQGFLVLGHKFHRRLRLEFQERRQRPVTETHGPPQPVEIQVKIQNPVVKMRTKFFEQMVEVRQAICLMAVNHQIFFPVGGCVNNFTRNGDTAEAHPEKLLDEFVVVSGDVDHLGLLAAFAEQFLDERVVIIAPEPAELQLPAVNEIAYKVKVFAVHHPQKCEQFLDLRVACAEMNVGDPDRAVFFGLGLGGKKFRMGDHKFVRIPIPHAL